MSETAIKTERKPIKNTWAWIDSSKDPQGHLLFDGKIVTPAGIVIFYSSQAENTTKMDFAYRGMLYTRIIEDFFLDRDKFTQLAVNFTKEITQSDSFQTSVPKFRDFVSQKETSAQSPNNIQGSQKQEKTEQTNSNFNGYKKYNKPPYDKNNKKTPYKPYKKWDKTANKEAKKENVPVNSKKMFSNIKKEYRKDASQQQNIFSAQNKNEQKDSDKDNTSRLTRKPQGM